MGGCNGVDNQNSKTAGLVGIMGETNGGQRVQFAIGIGWGRQYRPRYRIRDCRADLANWPLLPIA